LNAFEFQSPLLKEIRTSLLLDPRGALVHVTGQVVQQCSRGIEHKLEVDTGILVRGHQKEDTSRLNQVEWMIRSDLPKCAEIAQQNAEQLTTDLVESYIKYTWKDPCEKGKF
jgi:hypothetical protein